jgi:hypothetical protein
VVLWCGGDALPTAEPTKTCAVKKFSGVSGISAKKSARNPPRPGFAHDRADPVDPGSVHQQAMRTLIALAAHKAHTCHVEGVDRFGGMPMEQDGASCADKPMRSTSLAIPR